MKSPPSFLRTSPSGRDTHLWRETAVIKGMLENSAPPWPQVTCGIASQPSFPPQPVPFVHLLTCHFLGAALEACSDDAVYM